MPKHILEGGKVEVQLPHLQKGKPGNAESPGSEIAPGELSEYVE
jgi:hypothetical protein